MKKEINKFSLVGDKFMPKMHLRQPGIIYSAWEHLLKPKNEYKKSKKKQI